jgi:peptide/nickel transport system permease protein
MKFSGLRRGLVMSGRVLLSIPFRALPTLLAAIVVSFLLLRLIPGDAVDVMASQVALSNESDIAKWRHDLGLDRSSSEQLLDYVINLARLDFGYSHIYNMPVASLIGERLPSTCLLAGTAFVVAMGIGILAGVISGYAKGSALDQLISAGLLLLYSVPAFWTGLLLIEVFAVWLNWLPLGGSRSLGLDLSGAAWIGDRLRHLVLPALTLALFYIAVDARLVRASMLEIQGQDYIRTAVAKGLDRHTIVWKHMLRNALLPLTAVAGNRIGAMLGGAVTIETVFNWPGMGRLAFEAVLKRDFTVLTAILVLSAFFVIAANIIVDLIQVWIDPRIEH